MLTPLAPPGRPRYPRSLLPFCALIAAALPYSLAAETLYWDANGDTTAATGGSGTWDATSALWRSGTSTGALKTWNNTSPNADIAILAGSAATVTLNSDSTPIQVNQLQINTTGYTIAGPAAGTATLNLSGTTPTISVASGTASVISAIISGGSLTKDGAGALTLTGANTYTGTTTILGGTLRFGAAVPASGNGAFGSNTDAVLLGGGAANATLSGSGADNLGFDRAIVVQGAGTGTATITSALSSFRTTTYSGAITLGSGGVAHDLTLSASSYNTTLITGVIQDPLGVGATKGVVTIAAGSDGSSVRLNAANTFSGGLVINGAVRFMHGEAPGTGTITLNNGAQIGTHTYNVTVAFTNNNAQIWNGNFSMAGASGTINLGTGNVTLTGNRTISISNATLIVGGAISDGVDSYGLNFAYGQYTSGNIYLNGNSSFNGGVTIAANHASGSTGYLYIGNLGSSSTTSALGTGTFTIASSNGTIVFDNSSGAAGTLSTNNNQAWNDSFTFLGTRSLNMGNGVVILGADVTARVSANTLTVGGIQGDFVLTKDGAGILALSEAGSSTGGFVVSMGTLSVSGSGTLGLGNVTVNGGTLSLNNSIGIADTALLSINGGVVNLATGVNDTVGGLVLGGTVYTALGTYGGAGSGADYIHDTHFDGLGVITLVPVPEPGPAALLALAALAPWLARRRR